MPFISTKKKEIKPLPFPVYFWTVAICALTGLADSVYLSISHYRVYTDIGYKSFCAISRTINCDTVSQSPFSIFLDVPVPVWGIIGYVFFLLWMPLAWCRGMERRRIWTDTLSAIPGIQSLQYYSCGDHHFLYP